MLTLDNNLSNPNAQISILTLMLNLPLKKKQSIKTFLSGVSTLTLVALLSSCGRPQYPYQPEINLEKSPLTINKTIIIKEFKDNRIKKDKPGIELSLLHPPNFTKDLPTELKNAVINDFSSNLVFKRVVQQLDSADYVLVGEINNFNSSIMLTTISKISATFIVGLFIVPFIGCHLQKAEANIDLTMKIYSKNGLLIGTYAGSSFSKDGISIYTYKKKALGFPKKTNENFSNVVLQIREQITKDASKFDK